jgi:hypothetical protein
MTISTRELRRNGDIWRWTCRHLPDFLGAAGTRCRVVPDGDYMVAGRGLFAVAREKMRTHLLAYRTEQAYLHWMRLYVKFHRGRHPRECEGGQGPRDRTAVGGCALATGASGQESFGPLAREAFCDDFAHVQIAPRDFGAIAYFPMQKLEKISASKSSLLNSPVISPSARCARRRSSANNS